MRVDEKALKRENSCSIIGHMGVKMADDVELRAREELLKLVKQGYKFFFIGFVSGFERMCVNILYDLRKTYPEIRIILFRLGGELAFLEDEAEVLEKEMPYGIKDFNYVIVDAVHFCPKKVYEFLPALGIHRNRIMLDHSSAVLFHVNTDPKYRIKNMFETVEDLCYGQQSYQHLKWNRKVKKINLFNKKAKK